VSVEDMERPFGYVYVIKNTANNKMYVGITTQEPPLRWRNHINDAKRGDGGCKYLHRAIRKYGEDSFDFSVIDIASSQDDLHKKEKWYIFFLGTKKPHGYNLTDGGQGTSGYEWSDESRKKMSDSTLARWARPEEVEAARQKTAAWFSRPENREAARLTKLKEFSDPEKLEEHLRKCGQRILADGIEYPSQAAAARALGVSRSTIESRLLACVPGYEILERRPQHKANEASVRAVRIHGIEYSSLREAGLSLGVTDGTVGKRIIRGVPGYEYADGTNYYAERQERRMFDKRLRPVVADNVYYECTEDAARALGCDSSLVVYRVKKKKPGYYYPEQRMDEAA
jgi:group I intron endonuclease